MIEYLRDPEAIYRRSFEIIRAEADLSALPDAIAGMAVRLVHACGMTDIVERLAFSEDVAVCAREALEGGAPVLCDSEMVRDGIIASRLPADNDVVCTLNSDVVPGMARTQGTTRSAAAVDLWRPRLHGAVVAIGNAPTALFRLLELMADEGARPAAILGFPVGFVGAPESKQALVDTDHGVPYITLLGRRGGSAMAAAAVNALGGVA